MKNASFISIAILLGSIFVMSSCTGSTSIQSVQPAAFKVDNHIKTIATVNRSIPSKRGGVIMESVLTGEDLLQDRESAKYAIMGLTEGLTRTPRFAVKQTLIEMENGSGFSFPPPLNWEQVKKICKDYSSDALAALEILDTDNALNPSTSKEKQKTKEGKEIDVITYRQERNIEVKLGWRFYDPSTNTILDEFTVAEGAHWNSTGATASEAINNLPDQRLCTNETSLLAGKKYAMRIAPTWVNIIRSYYISGSKEMKNAGRLAKNNRWNEAAKIWQAVINQSDAKKKVKGKAAYNLAVANEVKNELDTAIEWAYKSQKEYDFKPAKQYWNELRQRKNDSARVKDQMNQ